MPNVLSMPVDHWSTARRSPTRCAAALSGSSGAGFDGEKLGGDDGGGDDDDKDDDKDDVDDDDKDDGDHDHDADDDESELGVEWRQWASAIDSRCARSTSFCAVW